MNKEIVYIGLGSNLDDPQAHVERAFGDLDQIEGCRLLARSSLYRSDPMGSQDQPDYINAVAQLETVTDAEKLLYELQQIEHQHGRVKREHWGSRTLDLDLLLYGSQEIDLPDLKVPHPGVGLRAFVLIPLYELAPDLEIPGVGAISKVLNNCSVDGVGEL